MGTLKSRTHKRREFVYYVLYCFSLSHLQINFRRIHVKTPYRCLKLRVSKSHLVMRETKGRTVPVNTLLLLWFLLFSWTVFLNAFWGVCLFWCFKIACAVPGENSFLDYSKSDGKRWTSCQESLLFCPKLPYWFVLEGVQSFFFVFLPLVFQFGTNGKLFKRFLFLFLSLISSPQIHLTPILSGEC